MKSRKLTEKETEIMQILWRKGAVSVREMLPEYAEPRPHFNTVSTTVRILEQKGHVGHIEEGSGYRYYAITPREECRDRSLAAVVRDFFDNSYRSAVSALVEKEKISVDDLRELIEMIDRKSASKTPESTSSDYS